MTYLMQPTILRLSSALAVASRQRWTAQLPKLCKGLEKIGMMGSEMCVPMSHHLETASAYRVDNFGTLVRVGDLELLLQKDGRLLV